MSDVQLTLLSLGLFVILIMLIHNWIQLRKHNKNNNKPNKSSQKSEITDENDPLFNPANPIFERESKLNPELEGYASEQLIRDNLPNGIFREIETVVSITSKEIHNGIKSLFLDELSKISDARIYVRHENEIWSTGVAIDETIRFNQILIVLLITSRKGRKSELEVKSFQSFVEKIKSSVDGSLFWLANQDIAEKEIELNNFRVEVDQSLFLKVIPKSDSSFEVGALLEFFEDPKIVSNANGIHELRNSTSGTVNICQLLSLAGKKLDINPDIFLQGILFKMDIPNTKNITYSFNEMIKLIELCKKRLNGVLVDVKSNELDEDKISKIYVSLKTIEDKMIKKNIMPGSGIAKKIFS